MLDEGANVDISSEGEFPPLVRIVDFCSVEAMKTFLEYRPNVHCFTKDGITTLLFAIQRGNSAEEVCKFPIAHGANLSGNDHGIPEAVFEAIKHPPILRLLFSHGVDIERADSLRRTLLHK